MLKKQIKVTFRSVNKKVAISFSTSKFLSENLHIYTYLWMCRTKYMDVAKEMPKKKQFSCINFRVCILKMGRDFHF